MEIKKILKIRSWRTWRTWRSIPAAFGVALMLHGNAAFADEEAVIGVFVPTTGALAPIGADMRDGYGLAVKHKGAINGKPIKLVVEDSQANAAVGLKKAQKLVLQDKAKVLVGGASSAVVLGINAQAARLNVPLVTTNSQAVQTTGEQCSRYLFRTNPSDAMVARGNAILTQKRPELLEKKWFVVFHDFVWGQSNKAEFAKIPGINIVAEAGRSMGTADWSSVISQIQASGADAIYLALAVGDDMPGFIRQARSFGLDQFMLAPLGMPDSMLQALGKDGVGLVSGGLFASWMLEEDRVEMAEFVKEYVAEYGYVPGPQAIHAYAGMQLVFESMEQARSWSTDDLIDALETTSADSIIGQLQIREEDHQGIVPTYLAESIQFEEARHGANVGWKVLEVLPWDAVNTPLDETGCEGF